MRKIKNIAFLLIIITFFTGCNLFSTRTPEEPDTGRSSFLPPTSVDIVVLNFINAIKEKETENYVSCFSDTAQSADYNYIFIPTSEANARYEAIFKYWDINSERRAFNSMVSNMLAESYPEFILKNAQYDVLLPDSAVYIAEYYLTIGHNLATIPRAFSGTLQFTLKPTANGMWSIQRWIDNKIDSDSLTTSWSILKANFAN